jgi:hypothetical protein
MKFKNLVSRLAVAVFATSLASVAHAELTIAYITNGNTNEGWTLINGGAKEGVREWSTVRAPQAGFQEQVYFMELLGDAEGKSQVLLRNAKGTLGVGLHFNLKQLPVFTLWKNAESLSDGYVCGLEPGTNFPNPRSYEQEQGRVELLMPGEFREFDLSLKFLSDEMSVAKAAQGVVEYQAEIEPKIHQSMLKGWSRHAAISQLS